MPKPAMNLKGRTYGRLKVLKRVPTPEHVVKRHKSAYWLCRCSCGTEVILSADKIRQKHTRSCGCLAIETTENSVIEMTGQIVGKLTVLERIQRPAHKHEGGVYWLCQCECGKQTIRRGRDLRAFEIQSCGCLSTAIPYTDPFEAKMASALNIFKGRYSDGNLTFQDFLHLTSQPCFYCGVEPRQTHNRFSIAHHSAPFSIEHGTYTYNGIDRIDSKQPHDLANCVTSCVTCNYTKSSDTLEVFYDRIIRIYNCSAGIHKTPTGNKAAFPQEDSK